MNLEFNPNTKLYLPRTEERNLPLDLSEVPRISGQEGENLNLDNLESIIEKPLVEGVRILYLKNIPTVYSSANGENGIGDSACVGINFSQLSKANKLIAEKLLIEKGLATIKINYRDSGVDVLNTELVGKSGIPLSYSKVENYFLNIAEKFVSQEKFYEQLPLDQIERYVATYIGLKSVEQMRKEYSSEKIELFIEEIKSKYDWSDPLMGKRIDD